MKSFLSLTVFFAILGGFQDGMPAGRELAGAEPRAGQGNAASTQPVLVKDGQALSPTGAASFHEPLKFARFYDGRSHQFDADPSVNDFVIAFGNAGKERKADAFLAVAEGQFAASKLTDFQKSAALEQAALFDKNATCIDQIPIEAVKKTAQMQHLLANFEAPEVVARFGTEDFSRWPFWKRGDGLHARGRAYSITQHGDKAESDLSAAVEWIGDPRTRETVLLALAQNRETNLKDDARALAAYEVLLAGKTGLGSADEYSAVLGIARIQTRRGQFDEALKTLHRAEPDKLAGVWKTSFAKAIEAVNKARNQP